MCVCVCVNKALNNQLNFLLAIFIVHCLTIIELAFILCMCVVRSMFQVICIAGAKLSWALLGYHGRTITHLLLELLELFL